MDMDKGQKKYIKTLNREFSALQKQEDKLMAAAVKTRTPGWKTALEEKVPEKVYSGLNSAFCKGFALVFQHGKGLIELTYKKDKLQEKHTAQSEAFQQQGKRKEIRKIHKNAKNASHLNIALTTVEGIGLGALGIGMPDIVLFLSTVLRGIYETALHYGFTYDTRTEQMLILKMMAASLSGGEEWFRQNREVNDWLLQTPREVTEEAFQEQIQATASVFAVDMLLLKFIQGLPVVGVLGGAANPLYYNKILRYIRAKYKRRYLLEQQAKL